MSEPWVLLKPFEVDGITYVMQHEDLMRRGMFSLKNDVDDGEWLLAQIDETENGALSTAELLEAMK